MPFVGKYFFLLTEEYWSRIKRPLYPKNKASDNLSNTPLTINIHVYHEHSTRSWHISYQSNVKWSKLVIQMVSEQLAAAMERKWRPFWQNLRHWVHWKLSNWQLSVQPATKKSSKLQHSSFSVRPKHTSLMCNVNIRECLQCTQEWRPINWFRPRRQVRCARGWLGPKSAATAVNLATGPPIAAGADRVDMQGFDFFFFISTTDATSLKRDFKYKPGTYLMARMRLRTMIYSSQHSFWRWPGVFLGARPSANIVVT